jgi:SanA protein
VIFGIAILLGLLILAGSNAWIIWQARGHRVEEPTQAPSAQAAIVLGAVVYPDGHPSAILEDRLETAVRLYEEGKVQKVLLSSGQGSLPHDQVGPMGRYVLERGVAPEDVFLDYDGFDTFDTMYRAREVFGVKDALVVTQSFHLDRSVYTARVLGLDATGVASDMRSYRNITRLRAREWFARFKAIIELHVLGSRANVLGPPMPISGDGRTSWNEEE